jgi:ubiquinone/menaquinone biosynthesis C-methylase UbiE
MAAAPSLFDRVKFWGMAQSFRIRDWLKPPEDVLKPVGIVFDMTVVDYGCGSGSYSIAAAALAGPRGKVYALDIDPVAVEATRRRALREAAPTVEVRHVRGFATGLPDACADRVLLMDMIHYLPDRRPLLTEVHRLLKPDGQVYIDIHHTDPAPIKAELTASGLFTITADHGSQVLAQPTPDPAPGG